MTFLTTGLLAGLLAAAIPIALHLLARQQPKRVLFPATRFLKPSLDTHRDRLKIKRWWLLALRVAAIATLALALARPQIHASLSESWFQIGAVAAIGLAMLGLATASIIAGQAKPLRYALLVSGLIAIALSAVFAGLTIARAPAARTTDTSPAAVAIVLDNSIRASRKVQDKTILAEMIDVASWFIDEQTSDSLIAIIDRTPRPATFSIDRNAAISRLDRTTPTAQPAALADRLRAAIVLVRSSELERKTVLMITDLTTPSFDNEPWETSDLKTLLEQQPPVLLQVMDVGSAATNNLSIGKLKLGDSTPPRLAKTDLSIVVQASKVESAEPPRSVNVQLDIYDTQAPSASGLPVMRDANIVLPPLKSVDRVTIETTNVATKVLLSVPPLDVGTHHGIVRLTSDDELEIDNLRYVTWVVNPSRPVLIASSNVDEANVLAGAINAPLSIDDPLAEYAIDVSEFPPADINAWKKYSAVILIDPVTPVPPVRKDLEAYLAAGGHVLSLLGPTLSKPDDSGDSFPAGVIRQWRVPAPGTFFEVLRDTDPTVRSLREIAGGVPWNAFRVSQYWQVEPKPTDVVIARYAGTDHPAILNRQPPTNDENINRGTHLIVTTPMPALVEPMRRWNELFSAADAWPAFLLIRDIVDSLVHRDHGSHNLTIGESTRITIDAGSRTDSDRVQVFAPSGPPIPIASEGNVISLNRLDQPGTYWIKSPASQDGVSVNLNERENDLSRIDEAKLVGYLGKENFSLVRSRDDIRNAEGKGQPTRSLYSTALLLMLAAFVIEQILSNRFYATKTKTVPAISAVTKATVPA